MVEEQGGAPAMGLDAEDAEEEAAVLQSLQGGGSQDFKL